ncbi:general transcription factor IIH subunit 1-like [Lineus longissimus]|uniref:general transcription factor IIH subunit 1-like n=1 Tax=Lineus longissimus TaxID=88925 RepID=UPI002B4E61A3
MSSEDVLLIVNHVKHKKVEGNMYMMDTRMAWMPASSDTFKISHSYADIRVQKISPDTKDKVQLQVVMHDNSANTFHFNNPKGRAVQQEDRAKIKELLQNLLPKFRRKINSELEEKNKLLQSNPEMLQLYKDLVVSGVITADEFWANRANKQGSGNTGGQDVGVSAAFLADIKPQTDGCNGLRYNLTADIIESIFRTYPAVKDLHANSVPDKLSESEFWTKFFQSHYFHRDRINMSSKDIFTECAKTDEKDIQKEIHTSINDPFIDLTEFKDDTLDEGYGAKGMEARQQMNATNLSMIRRFNHHSTMVLKSLEQKEAASSAAGSSSATTQNGTKTAESSKEEESEPEAKKRKIREKIEMEDLEDEDKAATSTLKLTKLERYLHGPTPVVATSVETTESLMEASESALREMETWRPNLVQVLDSKMALSVLGELSPGGALMYGTSQQQLSQMVPQDLQQEIKQSYSALCELLRHFWMCFPTNTKFLEEKVIRMQSNLERFQQAKLNPLKDKLRHISYNVNLTGHIEELLNAAYIKFETWQARRQNKR